MHQKQMRTLVQLVESMKVPLGACSTGVRLDREQLGRNWTLEDEEEP